MVIRRDATNSLPVARISNNNVACRGTPSGLSTSKPRSKLGFGTAGIRRDLASVLPLDPRCGLSGLFPLLEKKYLHNSNAFR